MEPHTVLDGAPYALCYGFHPKSHPWSKHHESRYLFPVTTQGLVRTGEQILWCPRDRCYPTNFEARDIGLSLRDGGAVWVYFDLCGFLAHARLCGCGPERAAQLLQNRWAEGVESDTRLLPELWAIVTGFVVSC